VTLCSEWLDSYIRLHCRRYITFNDNRPCLELIEGGNGSVGILNTLDDAWGGMGSTSEKDGKFVAQLHKLFGKLSKNEGKDQEGDGHKHFITPKFGKDTQFVIVHYAGEVSRGMFQGAYPIPSY
jgi:myosin heavy subunit